MRLFHYKCTVNHMCAYEWGAWGDNGACIYCGVSYKQAETIWHSIKRYYWRVMPYNYRLSNIWWSIKDYCWNRWTTVKPRTLDHSYCDTVTLMPHIIFELLCRFVEKELDNVDWEWDEEHSQAKKRMLELYDWWLNEYEEDYPWNLNENDWKASPHRELLRFCGSEVEVERAYKEQLLSKCIEIVNLSPYMWT